MLKDNYFISLFAPIFDIHCLFLADCFYCIRVWIFASISHIFVNSKLSHIKTFILIKKQIIQRKEQDWKLKLLIVSSEEYNKLENGIRKIVEK